MRTLKDVRGRLEQVGKDMKTLMAKGEAMTQDDVDSLSQLDTELAALVTEAETLIARDRAMTRANELQAGQGSVANAQGTGQGAEALEGQGAAGQPRQNARARSVGEQFALSPEIKQWLANGGAGKSAPVKFGSLSKLHRVGGPEIALYANTEGGDPTGRHDLVNTTATPDYMVPPDIRPGIFRPRDYALTMRDVLINGRTTRDTIYFLRENVFTNNAAAVAQATATSGGTGLKPESAITYEQDDAPVVTIAHWIPITRQAVADAPQLMTHVQDRLLVGLDREINSQIAAGDGSGGSMTGLLETTGIQELDDTYFGANPVSNAGTQLENYERIYRGKTEVELTGDAMATFVALNPRDLEMLQTIADDNKNYIGGGPFSNVGIQTFWGLPVARDRDIPEGQALVGDGTMAAIFDREDAQILIDTIDDQFIRNMLTILAEARLALAVFRPKGFALIDLVAA